MICSELVKGTAAIPSASNEGVSFDAATNTYALVDSLSRLSMVGLAGIGRRKQGRRPVARAREADFPAFLRSRTPSRRPADLFQIFYKIVSNERHIWDCED